MRLFVTFAPQKLSVSVDSQKMGVSFGTPIARDYVDRDPYEGAYTVDPGQSAVVLETRNLWMHENVTVNPIPNYYGLITWDGSKLTVS